MSVPPAQAASGLRCRSRRTIIRLAALLSGIFVLACTAPGQASPAPATDPEEALTRCFTLRRSEPAAAIVVAESLLRWPSAPDFEIKALSCLGMAAGIAGDSTRAIASAERMASLLDAHPQPDDFTLRALSNAGAPQRRGDRTRRAINAPTPWRSARTRRLHRCRC